MHNLILWFSLLWVCCAGGNERLADVDVFIRFFEFEIPISGAVIIALEQPEGQNRYLQTWTSDNYGRIRLKWPIGEKLTLSLKPSILYIGLQSATVSVPKCGLTGPNREITFQVPTIVSFQSLKYFLEMKYFSLGKKNSCTIITTVTPPDKTLEHCPHGLAGIQLTLDPPYYDQTYYFDMIRSGPLDCKTDLPEFFSSAVINYFYHRSKFPLHQLDHEFFQFPMESLELDRTSEDGGVMFLSVTARDEPYTIIANDPAKPYQSFTPVTVYCYKGGDKVINISPPQGPRPITVGECPLGGGGDYMFRDQCQTRFDVFVNTKTNQSSSVAPVYHHLHTLFQMFHISPP